MKFMKTEACTGCVVPPLKNNQGNIMRNIKNEKRSLDLNSTDLDSDSDGVDSTPELINVYHFKKRNPSS